MRKTVVIFIIASLSSVICSEPVKIEPTKHAYQDGKTLRVPMNETASEELLEKWLSQAISGLMAAVASKEIVHMENEEREAMQVCSQAAKTVPDHARCVVKILDAKKRTKVIVVEKDTPSSHLKSKPVKNSDLEWVGGFGQARAKRQSGFKVVNRASYEMRSEAESSSISKLARQMTRSVRKLKDKEGFETWRQTITRVKKVGEQAKEDKKRREAMKKRLRMMIDNTPKDFVDPRKPIAIKQMEMEDEDHLMKKMMMKEKKDEMRVPLEVLRESVRVALQLGGKNTTDFDKKTLKLVSPRFMSIVPEQEDDSLFNMLSPSLFSLHDEGSATEQLTSLPRILKTLNNTDQEAWMDFIIEAAGVSDAIDMTEKHQKEKKNIEMRGTGGVPLFFNKENATEILGHVEKKKIEVFEKLDATYDKKQRAQLDKQGFAFLSRKQLDIVYGTDSPYHKEDALRKFRGRKMRDDPHHFIEHDIRALAEAEKFKVRRHDIVGSPFILTPLTYAGAALSQPVILSPLVLSPITLSPAVLGPIILSPWVFVPLVLSPRVLSPLILSPLVFSPIILSPLVLHPLILVPGIFNPLILSPLVLSPLILSPQVFTPLILSPMVLNPLILSPAVGSPLILSPFVLSPLILSPQALFAVVLSPYALSPLIESKLIASEVILSPSWLS